MKSLGSTLKEARELVGFTLRQVEERTGLSNAYMSQLENDKIKKPSANVLYKLAKVYKVELNTLLRAAGIIEKSEDETKKEEEIGEIKSEWVNRIAHYADNLNTEQQSMILEYIKFLQSQKK